MNKIIGGILSIVALYVLFIYNDGALFMRLTDLATQYFIDNILDPSQP